ncbi:MAG: hypothetical protein VKJ02_18140 [Snowella sp.]|nr:hypothetical protein [Snowella sp.]
MDNYSLIDPLFDEEVRDSTVYTVITDKLDYAPGETATITASGFEVGSTIKFEIQDDPTDPGDDGEADVYPSFSITDGGEGDLDGVANGQVVTTWFVPTDNNGTGSGTPDALNATLILTATGSDGQVATTTFTDSDMVDASFEVTTDLIAGGGSQESAVDVGNVIYGYNATSKTLTITYQIEDLTPNDTRDDWHIGLTHFDYSISDLDGIPTNKSGLPQIGHFDYKSDNGELSKTKTFEIENISLNSEDILNLAAHAEVFQLGGLDALEYSLPDQVKIQVVDYPSPGDNSYFDTKITSTEASWLNGTYDGWCVDTARTIGLNTDYTANVYSSYENLQGIVDKPNNLDAVNWLLNNFEVGDTLLDEYNYKGSNANPQDYPNEYDSLTGLETPTNDSLGTITYGDIQRAIWALIDDTQSTSGLGSYTNAKADELADRAYLLGQGFTPECDDTVAIILQPINSNGQTNAQVTIAQVTLAELGIPCEGREETAWGEGAYKAYGVGNQNDDFIGGGTFADSSWAMYSQVTIPGSSALTI